MRNHIIASSLAGIFAVSAAHAEIIVGNNTGFNPTIWEVDETGIRPPVPVITGQTVSGLTYDPNMRRLYWTNSNPESGQLLFRADYIPGQTAPIDPIDLGGVHTPVSTITMQGLAFNSITNVMYGFHSGGGQTGFYRVSQQNATCVLTNLLVDVEFDAIDFNDADGFFYGVNNAPASAALPGGPGLYRISGVGSGVLTFSLLANMPDGDSNIDGLAAGPETLYLINDVASQGIIPYSLVSNSYLPAITTPLTGMDAVFAGGAYATPIPEPATLAAISGLGALALRRRSRR